jgi:DNA polymerase
MRWTERQRAMLHEIGVRLWAPAERDEAAAIEAAPRPAVSVEQACPAAELLATPARATPAKSVPTVATVRSPVGELDWPALREAVAACTACTLCQSRRQTVFGVGHPRAHWMIVGEAPGEQEDRQGEPFVGKSGQLLDNMLRAISLTRGEAEPARQVFIANTLKCRPPGNRNPTPEELAKCEPFLIRQVQLVQPKIILAMGAFAVQSLLRSHEPVGRLRGRVHHYQGVPLIVTYHPAYLLRNLVDKAKAWDDLCLAVETLARAAA